MCFRGGGGCEGMVGGGGGGTDVDGKGGMTVLELCMFINEELVEIGGGIDV